MQHEPHSRVTTSEPPAELQDDPRKPVISIRVPSCLLLASYCNVLSSSELALPLLFFEKQGWMHVSETLKNSAASSHQESQNPPDANCFKCLECGSLLRVAHDEFMRPQSLDNIRIARPVLAMAHKEGCTYRFCHPEIYLCEQDLARRRGDAPILETDFTELRMELANADSRSRLDLLQNAHNLAPEERESDTTAKLAPRAVVIPNKYSSTARLVSYQSCKITDLPNAYWNFETAFSTRHSYISDDCATPIDQQHESHKYRLCKERFDSFYRNNLNLSPLLAFSMANIGLYYAPDQNCRNCDKVRCAFCKFEKCCWSTNYLESVAGSLTERDDAHTVSDFTAWHRKFSTCPYVLDVDLQADEKLLTMNQLLQLPILELAEDHRQSLETAAATLLSPDNVDTPLHDESSLPVVGNFALSSDVSSCSTQFNPYTVTVKACLGSPPRYEGFCNTELRLATFMTASDDDLRARLELTKLSISDQPWDDVRLALPQNMAAAGFFTTLHNNEVHCFYCDLHLGELLAKYDPWQAHCTGNPECPYLRIMIGSRFVQRVIENQGIAEESSATPARIRDVMWSNNRCSFLSNAGDADVDDYANSQLDYPLIRALCESQTMGCSVANVRHAIHLCTQGSFDSIFELVEAVRDLLKNLQQANGTLLEQNSSRDDILLCKGCLTNNVEVRLFKCGHLLCSCCSRHALCRLCQFPISAISRILV